MLPASWQLLWAHLVLWWVLAHYLVLDQGSLGRRPEDESTPNSSRSFPLLPSILTIGAAGLITIALDWRLVTLFVIVSSMLVVSRAINPEWHVWERELLATITFASTSAWLCGGLSLELHPWLIVPVSDGRITVACLVSALFFFTIHGGTYIVRGILKASGVPAGGDKGPPDAIELKRGLWIGALERALLFGVVVAGSYEALGFVVAAKGLIRSRDLEANRDLTEYFLIGSLASVGVALATGLAARSVIGAFW